MAIKRTHIKHSRAVVCGTRFGQAWIEAISHCRGKYKLVGIISRGSRHSKKISLRYKVPMFTSVSAISESVDVAIVAVGGRAGEILAKEWLAKGVPVLLEHPVDRSFFDDAKNGSPGARLHVNGHFSDLPVVTRFINICKKATGGNRAFSSVVIATPRTLYSCIDIIVGLLPRSNLEKFYLVNPQRDNFDDLVFDLGPLRLKICVVDSTSSSDNAAGSLGGHFIQLWLPEQRITLLGPTGPIVSLGTSALRAETWKSLPKTTACSWNQYAFVQRPRALITALDRIFLAHSKFSHKAHFMRSVVVSRIWSEVVRTKKLRAK
jgi:thiazolinyl imide reductase